MPRGNGQVERYHRTILESMATMGAQVDDDQWDQNVANIQLGLNGSVNSALGVTPSEALMGFRVRPNRVVNAAADPVDVTKVREEIITRIAEDQRKQKERFDARRRKGHLYQVGDLVMTKVQCNPVTGSSQKLMPKWRGPFRVTKLLDHDRFEISDIPGAIRSQKKNTSEWQVWRILTLGQLLDVGNVCCAGTGTGLTGRTEAWPGTL